MSAELRTAMLALIDHWTENRDTIRNNAMYAEDAATFIRMHATADALTEATRELVARVSAEAA
jgi:hypothetical protein